MMQFAHKLLGEKITKEQQKQKLLADLKACFYEGGAELLSPLPLDDYKNQETFVIKADFSEELDSYEQREIFRKFYLHGYFKDPERGAKSGEYVLGFIDEMEKQNDGKAFHYQCTVYYRIDEPTQFGIQFSFPKGKYQEIVDRYKASQPIPDPTETWVAWLERKSQDAASRIPVIGRRFGS